MYKSTGTNLSCNLCNYHSFLITMAPPSLPLPSYCTKLLMFCSLVFYFTLLQQVSCDQKHHNNSSSKRKPTLSRANLSNCNLFSGTWVHDETYPVYQFSACPLIDPQFNCQMYGRPDSDYLKYRWKPDNCELPRFDGLDFLMKMSGKTVMFVGDSLGRNQWQSLICMVLAGVPHSSPTQMISGDPLSVFKFLEYEVSISFYRTPYLVDIDVVEGKRVLRLDEISKNSKMWKGVDVLSFNSGHWWTHKGALQGWDYMESNGSVYEDMDRLVAFERGMRTWARWVDSTIDATTKVFFQGISPVHYNPSEWKVVPVSKNCYGETGPINGSMYPGPYPDQMKVLQSVIRDLRTPTNLLDITTLSQLRKDAHPSIYNGDLTAEQRLNPDRSSDCSHWCLPGLPDTWNQLLYTAMFF